VTGFEVMELVARLNRERGTTVVYVTHDPRMARYATRLIQIRDGKILSDEESEQVLLTPEGAPGSEPEGEPAQEA
jgi:ABC-type lipoprotein export system ATPase subunit